MTRISTLRRRLDAARAHLAAHDATPAPSASFGRTFEAGPSAGDRALARHRAKGEKLAEKVRGLERDLNLALDAAAQR